MITDTVHQGIEGSRLSVGTKAVGSGSSIGKVPSSTSTTGVSSRFKFRRSNVQLEVIDFVVRG